MPRFPRLAVLGISALSLAWPALAQEAPAPRHPVRHRLRCLAILDLSEDQKTAIRAAIDAARPTLEADVDALRTARETLRAALDAQPPDACAIGSDALAVKAARDVLQGDREALKVQIEASLTPEQIERFEGCVAAPGATTESDLLLED